MQTASVQMETPNISICNQNSTIVTQNYVEPFDRLECLILLVYTRLEIKMDFIPQNQYLLIILQMFCSKPSNCGSSLVITIQEAINTNVNYYYLGVTGFQIYINIKQKLFRSCPQKTKMSCLTIFKVTIEYLSSDPLWYAITEINISLSWKLSPVVSLYNNLPGNTGSLLKTVQFSVF